MVRAAFPIPTTCTYRTTKSTGGPRRASKRPTGNFCARKELPCVLIQQFQLERSTERHIIPNLFHYIFLSRSTSNARYQANTHSLCSLCDTSCVGMRGTVIFGCASYELFSLQNCFDVPVRRISTLVKKYPCRAVYSCLLDNPPLSPCMTADTNLNYLRWLCLAPNAWYRTSL